MKVKMKTINIVIVEEDENLRSTLIELIELKFSEDSTGKAQKTNCIGFKNGLEFMKYVEKRQPVDAVILDMEMPELDGIGVLEVCRTLGFKYNFILYSQKFNQFYLKATEDYNIRGYLEKVHNHEKLFNVINIAMEGGTFISPYCSNIFDTIKEYKSNLKELQIAHLTNKGLLEKEIADKIKTSESSVKQTKQRMKAKFGLKTFKEVLVLLGFKKEE